MRDLPLSGGGRLPRDSPHRTFRCPPTQPLSPSALVLLSALPPSPHSDPQPVKVFARPLSKPSQPAQPSLSQQPMYFSFYLLLTPLTQPPALIQPLRPSRSLVIPTSQPSLNPPARLVLTSSLPPSPHSVPQPTKPSMRPPLSPRSAPGH